METKLKTELQQEPALNQVVLIERNDGTTWKGFLRSDILQPIIKLLSFLVILVGLMAGLLGITGLVSSCGTPNRTTVRVDNRATDTQTEIRITNGDGGTSSVTVSPKLVVSGTGTAESVTTVARDTTLRE